MQGVLKWEEVPLEATEALLFLIPKEEKPISIRSFRSISLCNLSTKLVTKVIVNQLKVVLSGLVAPNQTSFIPGRQPIDNVVVC